VLSNTIFGLSQAIYPMLVWLFKQKAEWQLSDTWTTQYNI
jgi:hypothetical protein